MSIASENKGLSATNYAIYCNRPDESLKCNNSYISLHQQNGITAKRKMIVMMDMTGFCGVIYRTKYAMICQPMTRIDTPIAVCFLLLLFAVEIPTKGENMCNYKY